MLAVLEKNDELGPELLIDMALYFSMFRVPADSSDLYSSLVAHIIDRLPDVPVAFATLNYDCLLEGAIQAFGIGFSYHPKALQPGSIPVWKLHGSCNFLPDLGTNQVIGTQFKRVGQIYKGPIKAVSLQEVQSYYSGEPGRRASIPPVMSYYAPGKFTPVEEETLGEIRQAWSESARAASRIVVIGARPILSESHVWRPILEAEAEVFYVGGESDGLGEMKRRLGGRLKRIAHYFSDAMPTIKSLTHA